MREQRVIGIGPGRQGCQRKPGGALLTSFAGGAAIKPTTRTRAMRA